MTARHSIAASRMRQHVNKIGSTVNLQSRAVGGEQALQIMLPRLEDSQEEAAKKKQEEHRNSVFSLSPSRFNMRRTASFGLEDCLAKAKSGQSGDHDEESAAPPKVLNREKLLVTMKKVIVAENESVPEWEKRHAELTLRNKNARLKRNSQETSQISILLLERKLIHAIRNLHQAVEAKGGGERLTSRMLLPHYKLADLKNFLRIFQSVDVDYSGQCAV